MLINCRRLHQEVTLPADFTCERCVLQLLRQAGEWAAPGGGYVFWSCADVSIVDSESKLLYIALTIAVLTIVPLCYCTYLRMCLLLSVYVLS